MEANGVFFVFVFLVLSASRSSGPSFVRKQGDMSVVDGRDQENSAPQNRVGTGPEPGNGCLHTKHGNEGVGEEEGGKGKGNSRGTKCFFVPKRLSWMGIAPAHPPRSTPPAFLPSYFPRLRNAASFSYTDCIAPPYSPPPPSPPPPLVGSAAVGSVVSKYSRGSGPVVVALHRRCQYDGGRNFGSHGPLPLPLSFLSRSGERRVPFRSAGGACRARPPPRPCQRRLRVRRSWVRRWGRPAWQRRRRPAVVSPGQR